MRAYLFSAIGLAALLAGCGQADEKVENDKFSQNFRASCIASAKRTGVAADRATRTCNCAITEIDRKYTTSEKVALKIDDLKPIMAECVQEVAHP